MAQEMPAIDDLTGGGGALAHTIGVSAGTTAGDDRDARISTQLRSKAADVALWQEIDDAPPPEIGKDPP